MTQWSPRDYGLDWSYTPGPTGLDAVILDAITAEEIVSGGDVDALLSIWDTHTHAREKYPWTGVPKISKVIEFDDVLVDKPFHGYTAPTREQVREIIEWGSNLPPGRLLGHCAAGISRSSASTLIIFAARGLSPEDAVKATIGAVQRAVGMRWRYPGIHPNRRIVEFGDDLLGACGKLVDAYEEHFELVDGWDG